MSPDRESGKIQRAWTMLAGGRFQTGSDASSMPRSDQIRAPQATNAAHRRAASNDVPKRAPSREPYTGIAVDSSFASNSYVYLLYTYEQLPLTPDGVTPQGTTTTGSPSCMR